MTGSIAASETIIAPSTDCSASRLCGCSSGAAPPLGSPSITPFPLASIAHRDKHTRRRDAIGDGPIYGKETKPLREATRRQRNSSPAAVDSRTPQRVSAVRRRSS